MTDGEAPSVRVEGGIEKQLANVGMRLNALEWVAMLVVQQWLAQMTDPGAAIDALARNFDRSVEAFGRSTDAGVLAREAFDRVLAMMRHVASGMAPPGGGSPGPGGFRIFEGGRPPGPDGGSQGPAAA